MTPAIVRSSVRGPGIAVSVVLASLAMPVGANAKAPEIRTTEANPVPACVTPDRLMAFLKSRNVRLNPRFNDIAQHYKTFGEAWRVRWDYAFFQMAIETNFLTYRAPSGRMGDVDPDQNNFAGIGTTGGGVPGDRFPDVKSGVHAQIQHLVVYSGERLAAPIAPRTQLKQDVILQQSLELKRPVRFGDLARRWAVDPNYDKSIEWVADQYRRRYCSGREAAQTIANTPRTPAAAPPQQPPFAPKPASRNGHSAVRTVWVRSEPGQPMPPRVAVAPASSPSPSIAPAVSAPTTIEPQPAAPPPAAPNRIQTAAMLPTATDGSQTSVAIADPPPSPAATAAGEPARPAFDPAKTPPSHLGAGRLGCSIGTASYGGTKTVLIKSGEPERLRYTALTVISGFERSLTDSYIKARAPGGTSIGEFDTPAAALEKASALCPAAEAQ